MKLKNIIYLENSWSVNQNFIAKKTKKEISIRIIIPPRIVSKTLSSYVFEETTELQADEESLFYTFM